MDPKSDNRPIVTSMLIAGLVAGTLDLLAALIIFFIRTGKNPILVLEFIASGVFGQDAFLNNDIMAVWGILFHYTIAFSWTIAYFMTYPYLKFLRHNIYISAAGYGGIVWLVMNLIVLPFSNTPKAQLKPGPSLLGAVVLMVCIGLPVAWMAHRHYLKK